MKRRHFYKFYKPSWQILIKRRFFFCIIAESQFCQRFVYQRRCLMAPESTYTSQLYPLYKLTQASCLLNKASYTTLLLSSKLTNKCPLVLSSPGHLPGTFLSLKMLLAQSATSQGVNRKNNLADHIYLMKVVKFQTFLP